MTKPLVLLFLVSLFVRDAISSGYCTTDAECHVGECTLNQCACFDFAQQDYCTEDLRGISGVKEYFYAYVAFTLVIFVGIGIVTILGFVKHLRIVGLHSGRFLTLIWVLMQIAILSRIIYFSVDPHKWIGFDPNWFDTLFYNLPLVLYINVQFLLVIHWSSIVMGSVSEVMQVFVGRFRRVAFGFAIFCTLTLLPASLGKSLTRPDPMWSNIYNAFCALYAVVLLVSSSFFGFKLYRIISTITKARVPFLKKLGIMLGLVDISLVAHIILLMFFIIETEREPFHYITIHLFLRFFEGLLAISVVVFLWRTERTGTTQTHSFNSKTSHPNSIGNTNTNNNNNISMTSADSSKLKHSNDSDLRIQKVEPEKEKEKEKEKEEKEMNETIVQINHTDNASISTATTNTNATLTLSSSSYNSQ